MICEEKIQNKQEAMLAHCPHGAATAVSTISAVSGGSTSNRPSPLPTGHDILFHVFYGDDIASLIMYIHAMGQRLYALTISSDIECALSTIMRHRGRVGTDRLKALFITMLNMDMPMKEYICNPNCKNFQAVAFNLAPQPQKSGIGMSGGGIDASINRALDAHSLGVSDFPAPRAARFYVALRAIVNLWMANEYMAPADLLKLTRDEYLVS